MNLDRKFLEGFSEVSAANGLTPSQAHQLLTKEAKLGTLGKILIGAGAGAGLVTIPTVSYFGGKYLLNKGADKLRQFGRSQQSYYNTGVYQGSGYGYGSGGSQGYQPGRVPHYTTWGSSSPSNVVSGSSGSSFNPRPGTPSSISSVPTPTTPLSARELADRAERMRQTKQQLDETLFQQEQTTGEMYKNRDLVERPNFARQIPIIGPWMKNRDIEDLQRNIDNLQRLKTQREQLEPMYQQDRTSYEQVRGY